MKFAKNVLLAFALFCASQTSFATKPCPQGASRDCELAFPAIMLAVLDIISPQCAAVDPGNARRYGEELGKVLEMIQTESHTSLAELRETGVYVANAKEIRETADKMDKTAMREKCREALTRFDEQ